MPINSRPSFPLVLLAAVLPAALALAPSTAAAVEDHMACFKVKAPAAFTSATVDLAASLPGFDLTGCSVKAKAAQYCVPVEKTVTSLVDGTPESVSGAALAEQRVCYKIKCPVTTSPGDVDVTDQFGNRILTAGKPTVVCTPAIVGPPSSCVDADSDGYGASCPAGPDCDDGDFSINPGVAETCDGRDNDCDASIDESDPMVGSSCASGIPGICSGGTMSCSAGSLVCVADQMPGTETCNSLDDDCDGTVDESDPSLGGMCTTGLGGGCSTGAYQCTAGSLVCSPTGGSPETCDNIDNDCDLAIDESLTRFCYTGPGGTAGIGVCQAGTQTCAMGSWGATCPGEVTPTVESCGDGMDNDCDGVVDEGC